MTMDMGAIVRRGNENERQIVVVDLLGRALISNMDNVQHTTRNIPISIS
jgi:hypothetical protein